MDTWFIIAVGILVLFIGLGEMWLGLIGNLYRKWAGLEAMQKCIKSDPPGIIGKVGTVQEAKGSDDSDHPFLYRVFVYGELWQARPPCLEIRLKPGQQVRVLKQDGIILIVEPMS